MARCHSCGSAQSQQSNASIKKFAENITINLQNLQYLLHECDRYKIRLKRHPELQYQYEEHLNQIRCSLSEYMSHFEDPYFPKLKAHFPQAADIYNKFRMHLLSHRILREL